MDEQLVKENKPSAQKSNFLLVCGLFGLYTVCILGAFGAIIGALQYEKQAYQVNITSTAGAVETQQANAEATAMARATAQDGYKFIERFDQVSGRWYVGPHNNDYGDATFAIKDGAYIWDIRQAKGFTFSSNFYKGNKLEDFDVYVDIRFFETESTGFVCAGLAFQQLEDSWNEGAFVFSVCNGAQFKIQSFDVDGWQVITTGFLDTIHPDELNRLEVSARGEQYSFGINGSDVFEMTDERLEKGSLLLFLEVPEDEAAEVWFDNFGYQSR